MFKMKNTIGQLAAIVLALLFAGLGFATSAHAQADRVRISTSGDGENSRSLMLPLGKAVIVELPADAADVLVSAPGTVDAVIRTPRRVYLLGMEIGQANAFFFDKRGRQIISLEIRVENDVTALTALYEKLLPSARITAEALNEHVILRGTVDSASEAASAKDIAARFADNNPDNVINMISIRERGQVMLKVRIVEMRRRLVKQLGINAEGTGRINDSAFNYALRNSFSISGSPLGGLSGSLLSPAIGDLGPIDFGLDLFEQAGLVKVLAEPNLTAVSGEAASFLAGGEFPVPVARDGAEISVEFKKFGVSLDFTPVVLSKGNINLKVSTEVSDVSLINGLSISGGQIADPNDPEVLQQVDGYIIPGLTVRRASTVIELPSGGSMAIAGLLQEDIQSAIEGLPGLKDMPVFGQLFRSNEFERQETELVIIVTPYLVQPTHLSELTDPSEGYAPANDAETILLGSLHARYGLPAPGTRGAMLQGPVGFILD